MQWRMMVDQNRVDELRVLNMGRKESLIELGAERLAEELLSLANHFEQVDERIDYITTSRAQNLVRFKGQLDALIEEGGFYDWREVSQFADRLSQLLDNLRESVEDPCEGIRWVAYFYEKDGEVMESCDDSGGDVGMVFMVDARDLFVEFAQACKNQEFTAQTLLELARQDEYGVRHDLIDVAGRVLSAPWMRWMVEKLQMIIEEDGEGWAASQAPFQLQSLARQLEDAPLFEATCRLQPLSFNRCLEIAKVYLQCAEVEQAESWVERAEREFSSANGFRSSEYQSIRKEIYHLQGNVEEEGRVAWEIFRSSRSVAALDLLLETLGEGEREAVIAGECEQIIESTTERLVESDLSFLLELEKIEWAERYLLARAAQLKEVYYVFLTAWVEPLKGRPVIASLIYRALLDDILERGYTKAYHHGVDYWMVLQQLSHKVESWAPYRTHVEYQRGVEKRHGRKRSFWGQVAQRHA
ncbi:MAG: hypothetical protein HN842_06200 [Gammaproteobacteria bacterium]|jgi:hypothetical protein|nr:hypothetical protein [Gammaproteobacteria bacterium]